MPSKRKQAALKEKAQKQFAKREAMKRGDKASDRKTRYRDRQAARYDGKPVSSRAHESPPWWTNKAITGLSAAA